MWAGPDSAQKGWANLCPTVPSASLVWAGTGPTQKRGELFSPSCPLTCRTNIVLHAVGDEDEGDTGGERKVTRPGGRGALAGLAEDAGFTGGAAVAAGGRERERRRVKMADRYGGWFFGCLWTQISPPLEHENHIYLQVVEEGHFVSSSAKCRPLVRPESTPTIASKKQ